MDCWSALEDEDALLAELGVQSRRGRNRQRHSDQGAEEQEGREEEREAGLQGYPFPSALATAAAASSAFPSALFTNIMGAPVRVEETARKVLASAFSSASSSLVRESRSLRLSVVLLESISSVLASTR